ncbi:MAG: divergent PAP2 family protein [Candidatus Gastranaerophilales bacterium]|nr:divergent PAP2 family protein [Candidatus Gastranaerophilales bacterium]
MIVNTGKEIIISSFIATFTAQFLKFSFYYIKNKKINFRIFASTGEMPSSHSAAVIALTTSVGLIRGFESVEFAIALIFSLIVMYDAAGLRRSAGKMATQLNLLADAMWEHKPINCQEKLGELLGHTPLEVTMGALLGAVVAFFYHFWMLAG